MEEAEKISRMSEKQKSFMRRNQARLKREKKRRKRKRKSVEKHRLLRMNGGK